MSVPSLSSSATVSVLRYSASSKMVCDFWFGNVWMVSLSGGYGCGKDWKVSDVRRKGVPASGTGVGVCAVVEAFLKWSLSSFQPHSQIKQARLLLPHSVSRQVGAWRWFGSQLDHGVCMTYGSCGFRYPQYETTQNIM